MSQGLSDRFDLTQSRESTFVDPAPRDETFTAEEMLAMREQYAERVAELEAQREELEFRLRRALAALRDAEADSQRTTERIRGLSGELSSLLSAVGDEEPTQVRAPVPARPVAKVAVPPPRKSAPPPIPVAARATNNRGPLPPRNVTGYRRVA
jgi:hypothetical protein